MKKISLLFVMLLALAGNAMAQNTVPVPADPDEWQLDWIDGVPYIHSGDGEWKFNSEFMVHYGMDIMSNLVANDYDFDITRFSLTRWDTRFWIRTNSVTASTPILMRFLSSIPMSILSLMCLPPMFIRYCSFMMILMIRLPIIPRLTLSTGLFISRKRPTMWMPLPRKA